MLFASAVIGIALARVILRPLTFIRKTAARIGSDNLSERIPPPRHDDELARLEDSFNRIKHFAAEALHELKTPLSLIRLHGEKLLEDEALSPASVDAVIIQLDEVARLNLLTNALVATPERGTVSMTSDYAEGQWRITTDDEGPGLAESELDRIFDQLHPVRFARTTRARQRPWARHLAQSDA